jgi:sulfoxide reductase heme-binding subunit YedZ
MRWLGQNWTHSVHPAALGPLALLIYDAASNHLTANPIQAATQRTGLTALVLLVLCLACTPLTMLGWKRAGRLRRPLGLYAFLYATLHMLLFFVVDYGLNWDLIVQAVTEKRYALAGLAAFLLLTPLALTSTKGWQRRLGKRWKRLHRLIYVAALLVVLHFVWLVKSDLREPLLYGAVVVALLALRLPTVRRAIARGRSGWAPLAKAKRGPAVQVSEPHEVV